MSVWDSHTPVGRAIRLPLRLVPPTAVVRVLSGPMRGMRWVVGSTTHGAWLGTLERDKLRSFVSRIRPGMTVWDIGAHVGLYTLSSARAGGPGSRVYAFEPMPRNLRYLRQHVALNGVRNVVIVPAAVTDHTGGTARMASGDSSCEFHVDPEGELEVPTVTLDVWGAASGGPPPDLVKMDVEGAEAAVLRGGAETFARYRPPMYLALHGESQRHDCGELLDRWGYRVRALEPGRGVEVSSEWVAEPR